MTQPPAGHDPASAARRITAIHTREPGPRYTALDEHADWLVDHVMWLKTQLAAAEARIVKATGYAPDGAHDGEITRLEGHVNAAEYWVHQADNFDFPDPCRTECLQLAGIHAQLAAAIAASGMPELNEPL